MLIGFDLDDTLLDHQRAERLAAQLFYRELITTRRYEVPHTEQVFVAQWQYAALDHMARHTRGEVTFQAQRQCRIRHLLGEGLNDHDADTLFDRFLIHYEACWRPYPDVVPVVVALAEQHPLIVITNGHLQQQRRKLAALGLTERFDAVITPSEAGAAKPSPALFDWVCQHLGKQAPDCWYIGNDLALDVLSANSAGWTGIWINRGPAQPEAESIIQIHSLWEVPGLIAAFHGGAR